MRTEIKSSRPYRPKLHIWRIEFEQAEIDATWQKVRDYRDEQAAAGLLEIR